MVGARSQTRSWHPEAANSPGNRPIIRKVNSPVWWLPRSTRPLSSPASNVQVEECQHVHRSAQLGLGRQDVVTRLQLTSHRGPQRASNGGLTGLGPARLGPARSEVCPLRRSCDLLGIVVANGSPAGTPLYDRPRYSWPRDATKPRTLESRRSIQVPTLS